MKYKDTEIEKRMEEINISVSDMLTFTSVLTDEIIEEAKKYDPECERIFIRGAAWMLYRLVRNRGQRHIYVPNDMSLDEAIKHCEEVLPVAETSQCAKEHIQLRNWLIELKEYKEGKR